MYMKARKGFTMMETVVAIVMVAILATYTFTSLNNTNKTIMRGRTYVDAVYMALSDVNRGVPIDIETNKLIRKTTVTEEDGLFIIETYIKTNIDKEPVEVRMFRYKRGG